MTNLVFAGDLVVGDLLEGGWRVIYLKFQGIENSMVLCRVESESHPTRSREFLWHRTDVQRLTA